MKIPLAIRLSILKLTISNKLWELRGLPSCPYHGFHAQSWWTGYCRECGEKPVIPPMDNTCTLCGEEKPVLQRASPNGDKEIWSLCWDCDKFIDWSELNSIYLSFKNIGLRKMESFEDWVFKRYQVYPKNKDYTSIVLKRK